MGGPSGTRAKRLESGTPCKCTTLAWTAAKACTACHTFPMGTVLPCSSTSRRFYLALNIRGPRRLAPTR